MTSIDELPKILHTLSHASQFYLVQFYFVENFSSFNATFLNLAEFAIPLHRRNPTVVTDTPDVRSAVRTKTIEHSVVTAMVVTVTVLR